MKNLKRHLIQKVSVNLEDENDEVYMLSKSEFTKLVLQIIGDDEEYELISEGSGEREYIRNELRQEQRSYLEGYADTTEPRQQAHKALDAYLDNGGSYEFVIMSKQDLENNKTDGSD